MTLSVVKRYLIAFDQYKWVGLATLAATVGVSGVVALQPTPPPVYVAAGTLRYDRPQVIFSSTTTKIQQEGQEITKDMLLDEEKIVKPVIEQANQAAKQVNKGKERTKKPPVPPVRIKELTADDIQIKMPSKNNESNALIQVLYKNTNSETAKEVVKALMKEMVARSETINTSRLRETIAQINQRLPKVTQELRETEEKLEAYEKREGTSILAAQSGVLPQAIISSEQQQRQLRVQESLALSAQMDLVPSWMDVDAKKFSGVFKAVPERSDLPSDINEALIVELYSK